MKKIFSLITASIILLTCPCLIHAQTEPVPISGTNVLREQNIPILRETQDGILADIRILADIISNGDNVGDSAIFWSYNFRTAEYEEIWATCRSVSDLETGYKLNIWVEDGQTISDDAINNMRNEYRLVILPNEINAFGSPPAGDFTILILDIQDHYPSINMYYAGYFNPVNEDPNLLNSNGRHMIYLDSYPGIPGSTTFYGTLAHEFLHLIHYSHDPYEETWVNEGLAGLALLLCGYGHPTYHINAFAQAPSTSLVAWEDRNANYGASYLFILYLYERYGVVPIRDIVSSTTVGIAGINSALAPYGTNMNAVFRNWVVANYLNDTSIYAGRYGYTHSFDGISYAPGNLLVSNIRNAYPTSGDGVVHSYAADYTEFSNLGGTYDHFIAIPYSVNPAYNKSYSYTARLGSLVLNISGLDGTLKAVGIQLGSSNPPPIIINLMESNTIDMEGRIIISNNGGNGGDSGCFIATAAFGSPLSDDVKALREFRDRYLLSNSPGRVLVSLYYAWSPPLADQISRHENLRFFARLALYPVIYMSKAAVNEPRITGIVILSGFLGVGVVFIRRKLRKERN